MRSGSLLTAGLALALLGDVLAQSGSASSVASSTSSMPSSTTRIKTTVQLPPLYTCEYATWTYTAPTGPKFLGVYLSGMSDFIETYALPSVYDSRTNGSFTWRCDLPAGASVAAMFYVLQDGSTGTNGDQASTPDAVINAGSSTDCLGSNDPSFQAGILSLASSIDPSFSYTAGDSSATPGSTSGGDGGGGGGGGAPIGAIVGGVVGGVVGIALVGALLIYLRHKHNKAALAQSDGLSVYSGTTEKRDRGSLHHSYYTGGPGSTAGIAPPPRGTHWATDAQGNVHLVMGYPGQEGADQPYVPPATDPTALETPSSPQPRQTAPVGTLPEPMDEPSPPPRVNPAAAPPPSTVGAPTTPVRSPAPLSSENFTPVSERDGFLAHHGLDDPSSFSPLRSQR